MSLAIVHAVKRPLLSTVVICVLLLTFSKPAWASNAENEDFDNDGHGDFFVYRPSQGNWYVALSSTGDVFSYQFGLPGSNDVPVSGNYLNTSRPDLAVYRPSTGIWFLQELNSDLEFSDDAAIQWGGFPGDIPVPCDFYRDNRNSLVVFRKGVWFVQRISSSGSPIEEDVLVQGWGGANSIPIPFDFDTDRQCDFVVFDKGIWSALLSSKDYLEGGSIAFGAAGDTPIPGKWTDDEVIDLAVYRESNNGPSKWIILESETRGLTTQTYLWGQQGDIPVIKDIDGDFRLDIVIWRPGNAMSPDQGTWYALTSSSDFQEVVIAQFGLAGDIPMGEKLGELY